jgi:hypothetical protein
MEIANSVVELDISCDFAYPPGVNIGSGCSNQVGKKSDDECPVLARRLYQIFR